MWNSDELYVAGQRNRALVLSLRVADGSESQCTERKVKTARVGGQSEDQCSCAHCLQVHVWAPCQLKKLGVINMGERKAQLSEGLPVFQSWVRGPTMQPSIKVTPNFSFRGTQG